MIGIGGFFEIVYVCHRPDPAPHARAEMSAVGLYLVRLIGSVSSGGSGVYPRGHACPGVNHDVQIYANGDGARGYHHEPRTSSALAVVACAP